MTQSNPYRMNGPIVTAMNNAPAAKAVAHIRSIKKKVRGHSAHLRYLFLILNNGTKQHFHRLMQQKIPMNKSLNGMQAIITGMTTGMNGQQREQVSISISLMAEHVTFPIDW